MSVVYLLRHGQASFGAANYDVLSAHGIEQSKLAGKELTRRDIHIGRAYSGSLSRQRETAVAALGECGPTVAITEDPRFDEYDFDEIVAQHGTSTGAATTDPRGFQRSLDSALLDWIAAGESTPCARSWPQFRDGARYALDGVFASLGRSEQALVVTSGGIIGAVCAQLLGAGGETVVALNRVVVNAALTKLVSGRTGVSLVSFNEHGHFDGEAATMLTYR